MNFLEICRKVANQSGTIAGLPSFTTTAGATGRVSQLVEWVQDAWIDIQNERADWLFMRNDFLAPLTVGKRVYTPVELGITDFGRFIVDGDSRTMSLFDPEIGEKDEHEIRQVSWFIHREQYGRGFHDANRPSEWTTTPKGELAVGPKPDKAYMLRGEYRRAPQKLKLDADVPIMPEQFHGLIVGEAIRLMARSDENFAQIGERSDNYVRLRRPLVRDQTPEISWGTESL